MNAKERKQLSDIVSSLEAHAARVKELASAEQEKFDNLGERAQENDKGVALQELAEALEQAGSTIEEVADMLDSLKNTK